MLEFGEVVGEKGARSVSEPGDGGYMSDSVQHLRPLGLFVNTLPSVLMVKLVLPSHLRVAGPRLTARPWILLVCSRHPLECYQVLLEQ